MAIMGPILDMIAVSHDVKVCHTRSQVTSKLIFTASFYRACGAQPLCLLGYYTTGL
jgi:hypothetical protein